MRYRAELTLPINSPIKEVITLKEAYGSKKLAQMVVALEVSCLFPSYHCFSA